MATGCADLPAPQMGCGVYPHLSDDAVFERETKDKVIANVSNKLLGTSGGTIVFRHNGSIASNIRSEMAMRELQQAFSNRFGRITTTLPAGLIDSELFHQRSHLRALEKPTSQRPDFLEMTMTPKSEAYLSRTVSYREMDETSTGFVPIKSLHTTVISRNVVDTREGESGWNKQVEVSKYFRGVFHFVETQEDTQTFKIKGDAATYTKATLLEKFASCSDGDQAQLMLSQLEISEDDKAKIALKAQESLKEDASELLTMPSIELKATEIKITDNGSLVIQWGACSELVALKKALVDFGAIAKRGLYGNMCGTTVGFFPNYHRITKEKRAELLATLSEFTTGKEPLKITIDPKKLSDVRFERNDLNIHFSKFEPLVTEDSHKASIVREYHLGMKKPVD